MPAKYWSHKVMETSDALDLQQGVFKLDDPKAIARSLKRSAEHSKRRKAEPFRSAMSMLTFFINRGGKNISAKQKRTLEKAKDELRMLYGREPKGRTPRGRTSRASRRPASRRKTAKSRPSARGSRRSAQRK